VMAQSAAHGLEGAARRLADELAVGTMLMGAYIKGEERLSLQLQADRPRVGFHGELDAEGAYRGRLSPTELPTGSGGIWGVHGALLAIKHDATREMYRGITPVDGTWIGEAMDTHLRQSTQTPAAVRIEVDPAQGLARGVLVEALPRPPGADPGDTELVDAAFAALREADMRALPDMLEGEGYVGRSPVKLLEVARVRWQCRCSEQKVAGVLRGLGEEELVSMADEDHGAEVTCHFCNQVYRFTEERLRALAAERSAAS
jgi:molecular chaperone Hsp33